jgi:hypothetical protein
MTKFYFDITAYDIRLSTKEDYLLFPDRDFVVIEATSYERAVYILGYILNVTF